MTVRHFLDTHDLSKAELRECVGLTRLLRAVARNGVALKLMMDASLGVSFEVAMTGLGGHALCLRSEENRLEVRESPQDTTPAFVVLLVTMVGMSLLTGKRVAPRPLTDVDGNPLALPKRHGRLWLRDGWKIGKPEEAHPTGD